MTYLDFFFDFSSPYAHLASTQVERVAKEHGAELRYRPLLLGALFKTIGTPLVPVAAVTPQKRRWVERDLAHFAQHWKVPFHWPSRFPMRTLAPLRWVLAAPQASRPALVRAIFDAYWVADRDIADHAVLRQIAAEGGHDPAPLERIDEPEVKALLQRATDEAVAAGLCGVPSFLVRGHLFWGQDRLDLVARTLDGWDPPGWG